MNKSQLLSFFLLVLTSVVPYFAEAAPPYLSIAKIRVEADGRISIDNRVVSLQELKATLDKVKKVDGGVWYWRANLKGEPPPNAEKVIQAIIDSRLPVSLSTKRDFSDYVDKNGRSNPRKRVSEQIAAPDGTVRGVKP